MRKLLRFKSVRTLVVTLALLAVLAGSFGASQLFGTRSTPAAHAASNGQIIEFACPPNIYWVTISGGNQNGNWVTWSNSNVNASVVYTGGWWWKGWVKITYSAQYGVNRVGTFTQWAYIPKWQAWPNWYEVDCNAR